MRRGDCRGDRRCAGRHWRHPNLTSREGHKERLYRSLGSGILAGLEPFGRDDHAAVFVGAPVFRRTWHSADEVCAPGRASLCVRIRVRVTHSRHTHTQTPHHPGFAEAKLSEMQCLLLLGEACRALDDMEGAVMHVTQAHDVRKCFPNFEGGSTTALGSRPILGLPGTRHL